MSNSHDKSKDFEPKALVFDLPNEDEGPKALDFGSQVPSTAQTGSSKMTQNSKTPGALNFDQVPSKITKPQVKEEKAPGALSFPETPMSVATPPARRAESRAPAALSFPEETQPNKKAVPPPSSVRETRTPAPLSFDHLPDRPAPPSVQPRNFAQPVFEDKLTEKEAQAIRKAKENFPRMFPTYESQITNGIKQLLPFDLVVVGQWGNTAMQKQGEIVNQMAQITREFRGMEIAEFLQDMIEAPKKLTGGLINRFINNREKLIKQYKARAAALNVQINSLQPKIENVRDRFKEEGQRIPVLLAALSSASAVAGEGVDTTLSHCIHQRRTMLQQSATQLQVIEAQMEEMRRQLLDYQGRLEQVLVVTLPALEMADANGV